jgi:hypothetical protein
MMDERSFEIEPRAVAVGGGWRLRLFIVEDGEQVEAGGGVYEADDESYAAAVAEGQDWVAGPAWDAS